MRTRAKRKKKGVVFIYLHVEWDGRTGRGGGVGGMETATPTEWIARSYIFKRVGEREGSTNSGEKRETF